MFFIKSSPKSVSPETKAIADALVTGMMRSEVQTYLAKTFNAKYALSFVQNATDAQCNQIHRTMQSLAAYR